MMHVSEQGISLIKKFEGFSAESYICPAGKPTIGYGHVIQPDESFLENISEVTAEMILKQDIEMAEKAINILVKPPLKQHEYDALVSFVFNIGIKAFENSTILRLINILDHNGASKQFGRWVYAGGKKLGGLINRRNAESAMFMGTSGI